MKYLFGITILILFLLMTPGVRAQSVISSTDKTYGLDPLLHNGPFYSYHIPSDTKGTPYFSGPDYVKGSVSLRGIRYDHLDLKYDVLNQLLIFQYQNAEGGAQHIVLSDAWLESFDLGDTHFELFAVQDTLKQIYQVIGSGSRRILYAWSKERTLDNQMGSNHFMFTKLKKKTFLQIDQNITPYKNNKGWTSLFDAGKQSMIKKHLVQQHINVKTASDQVMSELITYCNSL
jgi:hypothetical protein